MITQTRNWLSSSTVHSNNNYVFLTNAVTLMFKVDLLKTVFDLWSTFNVNALNFSF